MSWSSIFSDILKVIEDAVPIAELADPDAAAIVGAVGTIVTTLANHGAATPVTTTTTTVSKPTA